MEFLFAHGSLWKTRRELDAICSIDERTAATAQRCLELLRKHPSLAKRRHDYKLQYPLSIILECTGADLSTVMEVHAMYPSALSQRVTLKENCAIYPLHLACERGRVNTDVIPFLVQQFPRATQRKNWHHENPLHLLLLNRCHRSASVQEVEALLNAHPGALHDKSFYTGTPLSTAFLRPHTDMAVLDLLIQRLLLEDDFTRLDLGGTNRSCNQVVALTRVTNQRKMCVPKARLLCKVLPKLKVFHCLVANWEPEAFSLLLQNLGQLGQLEELTLTMVHPTHTPDSAVCDLLENTHNLRKLLLDFAPYHRNDSTGSDDDREGCIKNKVKALFQNLFKELSSSSSQNNTKKNESLLEQLHLHGGVHALNEPYFDNEFWPSVRQLLGTNTILQGVVIPSPEAQYKPMDACSDDDDDDKAHAKFLMCLNRHGRGLFRNPAASAREIVDALEAVNVSKQSDIGHHDKLGVLYGLLQEAPVVWSSCALDQSVSNGRDASDSFDSRAHRNGSD